MKKYILLLMTLLISSFARSWEYPLNPDRFPSIGMDYSHGNVNGDTDNMYNFGPGLVPSIGSEEFTNKILGIDFKLPVSNSWTFTVSYETINGKHKFTSNTLVRESSRLDGYRATIGARLYFNE